MHDPSVDEERYFSVVERKTATLFEAGARIAAVLAEADRAMEERCAQYGASLGRAFQIVDDMLDYSGHTEDIGKRLGDDLREGKVTLPLIHALRSAAPEQREVVVRAVRDGDGDFKAMRASSATTARSTIPASWHSVQLPKPRYWRFPNRNTAILC
jgi:octaprenyl-diphosphate synthase